ncbi:MAG: DUF1566 domain-containing protein [Deltaproteobacteria bacterium]|nr:DUF1566 domain-containing protein [Deltaproteobacteria bacterium]
MDDKFDVFLCHNSRDKPVVRILAESLQNRGLKVWLDEREVRPSKDWLDDLNSLIKKKQLRTAAVLVGPNGFGRWQNAEMKALLREYVERNLPVIPVLLPGAPQEVDLHIFLEGLNRVDFREGLSHDKLDQLILGITGRKPASPPVDPRKEPDPALAQTDVQDEADPTQAEETPETTAPVSKKATPRSDANSRFTDNGNGTVTDQKTGLIWLKNADCFGQLKWKAAVTACRNLADGQCGLTDGSKAGDWRLPTVEELKQLVNDDHGRFSKPGEPFTGVQLDVYWSSTTFAGYPNFAGIVSMHAGNDNFNGKAVNVYVWPVRGGITGDKPASPPADPPEEPDSAPRFTDNGNGTVTDLKTGLIWLKKADCFGRLTWDSAILRCLSLADGQCGLQDGSKAGDWRLPTREELTRLIKDDYGHFSEPGDPFIDVQSSYYWSSPTFALSTSGSWFVDMYGRDVHNFNKADAYYVWPVRGGR